MPRPKQTKKTIIGDQRWKKKKKRRDLKCHLVPYHGTQTWRIAATYSSLTSFTTFCSVSLATRAKQKKCLNLWCFRSKVISTILTKLEMAKDIHLKIWNVLPIANEKILRTYRTAGPYLKSPWKSFNSSCPFLYDKYTKSLFNTNFGSGKK